MEMGMTKGLTPVSFTVLFFASQLGSRSAIHQIPGWASKDEPSQASGSFVPMAADLVLPD